MGSVSSKISCVSFRPKTQNNDQSRGRNEEVYTNSSATQTHQELAGVRLSKQSLRRVSKHSIKPGSKLSLHSNEANSKDLPAGLVAANMNADDLVSIHDLYNMLNDGAMKPFIHDPFNLLLVDSRDLQYFTSSHIITAKHHATVMGDKNFTMRLTSFALIIIYGNKLKDDRDTEELANLRAEVQEYVAGDVLVLEDGFESFEQVYPFLCTDKSIETIIERKQLICYPSVILNHQLYQGRGDQATNESIIDLLKITHVLNISIEHRNAFPKKVKYLKLALEDVSQTNLFDHLNKTSDFINAALTKGGCVLVHCNLGVSRSSTATLAYLIKYKKWSLELAFTTLKARRSCACPNPGFFKQLSDWETEIFGKRITNVDAL